MGGISSCTASCRKMTALNTVTNLKAPLEGFWLGRNKYRNTRLNEGGKNGDYIMGVTRNILTASVICLIDDVEILKKDTAVVL